MSKAAWVGCAAILALAEVRLWPLASGAFPLPDDHPAHLHMAWYLWNTLLPRGEVAGWSSYGYLGEPVGDLYPFFPELWVAAFRAATGGMLSWMSTYSLAFVGFYAFAAGTLYTFGRRHLGATAGFIAALLWMIDPGAWEEGGWNYLVHFGVWPQTLGFSFLLLGLSWLLSFLDRGRRRDAGLAAALIGVSICLHPMDVALLGLAIPALVAGRAVLHKGLTELRRIGTVVAVAGALSAGWLLPMLARKSWARDLGKPGIAMAIMEDQLRAGSLYRGSPHVLGPLAILGGVWAIRRRLEVGGFLARWGLILFVASSAFFTEVLGADLVFPTLRNLQFIRFAQPAKAVIFLLAGFAVQEAIAGLRRWRRSPRGARAAAALGAVLSVGLAVEMVVKLPEAAADTAALETTETSKTWPDLVRWAGDAAQLRAQSPDFYQIAVRMGRDEHGVMATALLHHTSLYKVGYTPAKLYRVTPESDDLATYHALNVRYELTDKPDPRPELHLLQTYGIFSFYAVAGWSPERATLDGPGTARVERFEEEHIQIQLSGTGADSRIRLHVGPFPRWRARMNGLEVPITEVPLWDGGRPLGMGIPVTDGELELDYVRRPVDQAGLALSAMGIAACIALLRRDQLQV